MITGDRAATARYGINIQDVQDGIEAATKGRVVTQVFDEADRQWLDTVLQAVSKTGADASVIYVPPPFAADAILEAAAGGTLRRSPCARRATTAR